MTTPSNTPPHIMYVEDKPEMVALMQLIIQKKGWQFSSAPNGRLGLERIQTDHPDVVLLDLMMPEMDGWEVFRAMKANPATAHIPVIVITARGQSIDKVLGLHIAKVDDYITKPFGPAELIASIERVLEKRAT